MINKSSLALVAAVAIAAIASPAFAQAAENHHHHYRPAPHAERYYNSVPQAAAPSPYTVENTGGGSLGYNQHDEVKN